MSFILNFDIEIMVMFDLPKKKRMIFGIIENSPNGMKKV